MAARTAVGFLVRAACLAGALASASCGDEAATRAPADRGDAPIAAAFPDAIGPFRAVGEARPGAAQLHGRELVSAERAYDDHGREATLRIVDVSTEPAIVSSFAVARGLAIDELDALTRAVRVARSPAVVQWTRDTGESELQVLVRERYLVTLKVWPADRREEAEEIFPAPVAEALARSR